MNIEPFLIASTVRVVVGQRLVRRICPECREKYSPEAIELKHLAASFHLDQAGVMKQLHQLETEALEGGIGKDQEKASSTDSTITTLWKAHAEGCDNCNHTGYRGRIGIYEVLDNSSAIQKMIVTNETSDNIQKTAIQDGMVTMQQDGLVKALRGQTTIEEVLRVTQEE
jgi:type II secretory ATPase GspE/PulE/Tfp pilus assembly ATPase PilB-like protein